MRKSTGFTAPQIRPYTPLHDFCFDFLLEDRRSLLKNLIVRDCYKLSSLKEVQGRRLCAAFPGYYSCSLRAFLRLRLRASACFRRIFSPGFK